MDNIDFKLVGLEMKKFRNQMGISQKQVADDIGSTVAFVSNIENSRVKINLRMLLYYSHMCNVPVDVFLDAGRKNPHDNSSKVDKQIATILKDFSVEEKEKIYKMLRIAAQK